MSKHLISEVQNHPERFNFLPAPGRSDFWKTIRIVTRRVQSEDAGVSDVQSTESPLPGIVSCSICKCILKHDSKSTGSSHAKRHTEHCKPSKGKQELLTSLLNKKTLKLNESEKVNIKNAELQFCVRGYHSFNSLENDGLVTLLQTFANTAAKHGRFDVKDALYGRNTISSFCKEKVVIVKDSLRLKRQEPKEAESISVTLDLWTSNFNNKSYIDVHAFWVDDLFQLKHQCLAVSHFGTERHTAENISKAVQAVLDNYNIDASRITATTDHGANVVAAFGVGLLDSSARLDCMAHRLHTCFSNMWARGCSSEPELQQYDNHAAAIAKYCNQAAGLQEQLPASLKKSSTTRRWEGLIDRAHSRNESYNTLVRILSGPHRDRALLIASVNRTLNADILQFMQPFRKLFEVLQFNSKPTINFAVLTYYKAAALAKLCVGDNPIIATLKKEFTLLLDRLFFAASLKARLKAFFVLRKQKRNKLPTTTTTTLVGHVLGPSFQKV